MRIPQAPSIFSQGGEGKESLTMQGQPLKLAVACPVFSLDFAYRLQGASFTLTGKASSALGKASSSHGPVNTEQYHSRFQIINDLTLAGGKRCHRSFKASACYGIAPSLNS